MKEYNNTTLNWQLGQDLKELQKLQENFVTIDTDQDISGIKTFKNRINIGDISITAQETGPERNGDLAIEADNTYLTTGYLALTLRGIEYYFGRGAMIDGVPAKPGQYFTPTSSGSFEWKDIPIGDGSIDTSKFVTTDTSQHISGARVFTGEVVINNINPVPFNLEDTDGVMPLGAVPIVPGGHLGFGSDGKTYIEGYDGGMLSLSSPNIYSYSTETTDISAAQLIMSATTISLWGTSSLELKSPGGIQVRGTQVSGNTITGTIYFGSKTTSYIQGDDNGTVVIGATGPITLGSGGAITLGSSGPLKIGNGTVSAGTSGQVLTSQGASAAPKWTTPTVTSVTNGTSYPLTLSNGTLSHKTTTGFKHIPSGGGDNQILSYSTDGTAQWSDVGYYFCKGTTSDFTNITNKIVANAAEGRHCTLKIIGVLGGSTWYTVNNGVKTGANKMTISVPDNAMVTLDFSMCQLSPSDAVQASGSFLDINVGYNATCRITGLTYVNWEDSWNYEVFSPRTIGENARIVIDNCHIVAPSSIFHTVNNTSAGKYCVIDIHDNYFYMTQAYDMLVSSQSNMLLLASNNYFCGQSGRTPKIQWVNDRYACTCNVGYWVNNQIPLNYMNDLIF